MFHTQPGATDGDDVEYAAEGSGKDSKRNSLIADIGAKPIDSAVGVAPAAAAATAKKRSYSLFRPAPDVPQSVDQQRAVAVSKLHEYRKGRKDWGEFPFEGVYFLHWLLLLGCHPKVGQRSYQGPYTAAKTGWLRVLQIFMMSWWPPIMQLVAVLAPVSGIALLLRIPYASMHLSRRVGLIGGELVQFSVFFMLRTMRGPINDLVMKRHFSVEKNASADIMEGANAHLFVPFVRHVGYQQITNTVLAFMSLLGFLAAGITGYNRLFNMACLDATRDQCLDYDDATISALNSIALFNSVALVFVFQQVFAGIMLLNIVCRMLRFERKEVLAKLHTATESHATYKMVVLLCSEFQSSAKRVDKLSRRYSRFFSVLIFTSVLSMFSFTLSIVLAGNPSTSVLENTSSVTICCLVLCFLLAPARLNSLEANAREVSLRWMAYATSISDTNQVKTSVYDAAAYLQSIVLATDAGFNLFGVPVAFGLMVRYVVYIFVFGFVVLTTVFLFDV